MPSNIPGSGKPTTITLHLPLADIVEDTNSQHGYMVILPDKPDMIPQKPLSDEFDIA